MPEASADRWLDRVGIVCRLLEADHRVVEQESQSTAARNAKAFVSAAIAAADRFSVGHGPIHHFQNFTGRRSCERRNPYRVISR
jgi:hypothetical protein